MIDASDVAQIPWTTAPPSQAASESELREIFHAALRVAHERRIMPADALRRMWQSSNYARDWKLRRMIVLMITHLHEAANEERVALEARTRARGGVR